MSKRFDVVATNKELVVAENKSAIRVELQYGKDGEPTELVIAELYWKDGAWAYTRSQVRVTCNVENAKYLLDCTKAMYESSKKVVKTPAKSTKIEDAIDSMTDEEKAALLKLLTSKASPAPKTTGKAKAEEKSPAELVLESFVANGRHK